MIKVKYSDFVRENIQTQTESTTDNTSVQSNTTESKLTKFAPIIDYTMIRKGITKDNILSAIIDATANNFYGICVPPELVDYTVYNIDDNTKLKVISYANYPKGDNSDSENLIEVSKLIADNVDEIEIVMDYNLLKKATIESDIEIKSSMFEQIETKLRSSINECHKNGVTVKVIIEIGALTVDEVSKACEIVSNLGTDYVMTSTGMVGNGSDMNKIMEMRRILPDHVMIKVAGGVRTLTDCEKLYQYIDRIGTSVVPK